MGTLKSVKNSRREMWDRALISYDQIPEGSHSEAWSNDAMPNFTNGFVRMWVNYANEKEREALDLYIVELAPLYGLSRFCSLSQSFSDYSAALDYYNDLTGWLAAEFELKRREGLTDRREDIQVIWKALDSYQERMISLCDTYPELEEETREKWDRICEAMSAITQGCGFDDFEVLP